MGGLLKSFELNMLRVSHFFDDVRYAYLNEDNVGPEKGDMVSFLADCPELCHKPKVLTMFRLGCLCLPRVALDLPEVRFRSTSGVGDVPDLSETIRPVQSNLLSSNLKCNFFTDSKYLKVC